MPYTVILGIGIGIAFVGLIVSVKKQSSNTLAKPMVLAFTLIILTCGFLLLADRLAPPDINKLVNDKLTFSKSAGYRLAKYIEKTTPNSKIILLTDPALKESKKQKALIEGMNEVFNKTSAKMTVVSLPVPKSLPKKQQITTVPEKFTLVSLTV